MRHLVRASSLVALVASSMSLAAPLGYQKETQRDFYKEYGFGTIGIFAAGQDKSSASSVYVVRNEAAFRTRHHATCRGVISHYDPDRVGQPTFVGIQIIRVFRQHTAPDTVYVSRNSGAGRGAWSPRVTTSKDFDKLPPRPLPPQTEVRNARLEDFSKAHASDDDQEIARLKLTQTNDGNAAELWHARLGGTGQPLIDTAHPDYRRFWAVDPAQVPFYKKNIQALGGETVVRTENRLISFLISDAPNWTNGVDFDFSCNDQLLVAVYLRVFVPASVDKEAWYEVLLEQ